MLTGCFLFLALLDHVVCSSVRILSKGIINLFFTFELENWDDQASEVVVSILIIVEFYYSFFSWGKLLEDFLAQLLAQYD